MAEADDLDLSELEGFNDTPVAETPRSTSDSRFRLLATLISAPDMLPTGEIEFRELEKLIQKDFLRLTADIGIPGESALYAELLNLVKKIHELVEFPYLANKNIVAVGGEFSAGKSCFLNAIFGTSDLLPTNARPTTAIPTYLTQENAEAIRALNTFGRRQDLNREELKAISHGFNDDQAEASDKISFYHILKTLQVQSPSMRWKNIAFLDTPGYSKPKETVDGKDAVFGTDAGNTDEEKACEHLSKADYLIWVVGAKDGTFQHDGIVFLRDKVKWKKPLYLLVNKADEPARSNLPDIFNEICGKAESAGFTVAGRSAYSSAEQKVYLGDNPSDWFDKIDSKRKLTTLRGQFKEILGKVIRKCDEIESACSSYKDLLARIECGQSLDLSEEETDKLQNLRESLEKECDRRRVAVTAFSRFSDKVEKQLDGLLKVIGIAEESASDVGLTAIGMQDAQLLRHKKGDKLSGTVVSYSRFNGCWLSVAGENADCRVQIKKAEVEKVTDPAKYFAVGKKFDLTVYEVNFSKSQVLLTVAPASK